MLPGRARKSQGGPEGGLLSKLDKLRAKRRTTPKTKAARSAALSPKGPEGPLGPKEGPWALSALSMRVQKHKPARTRIFLARSR